MGNCVHPFQDLHLRSHQVPFLKNECIILEPAVSQLVLSSSSPGGHRALSWTLISTSDWSGGPALPGLTVQGSRAG